MNYERATLYFQPDNETGSVLMLIFGVFIFIVGLSVACISSGIIGICIIVIGALIGSIGGWCLYTIKSRKVSDKEIDRMMQEEIKSIESGIFNHLGIDKDEIRLIEPIAIDQYYFRNIDSQCIAKEGDDKKIRSSNVSILRLFFSEAEIFCYECRFSLIKNEKLVITDEYHYSDIVSMKTESLLSTKENEIASKNVGGESFTILTSGGSSFSGCRFVNLKDSSKADDLRKFQESVQGMKQLWRMKKIFE